MVRRAGPGLRQGEALGLQWPDLDLEAGTLTVRRALQRQTGKGLVLVEPKSRAGRRTIMLPEPLRQLLIAHRQWQDRQRTAAEECWEEHGFVFAQPNGRPIDARRDRLNWKALLKAGGVRDARLHDARHTAATLLLQQGVAARVAMQVLGHSQITLTLGTYSHVVPELGKDAPTGWARPSGRVTVGTQFGTQAGCRGQRTVCQGQRRSRGWT